MAPNKNATVAAAISAMGVVYSQLIDGIPICACRTFFEWHEKQCEGHAAPGPRLGGAPFARSQRMQPAEGGRERSNGWRFLPATRWIRGYTKRDLVHDLLAACVITAIIVPEGMAYAQLAGLTPEAVFYTAPGALLAYALLGPSNRLIVATSGAAAALCGSLVAGLGTSIEPASAAAGLALISGAAMLIAGLLRMGFISSFLSGPVRTGFVSGLAAVIAVHQLPKLLGMPPVEGNFFERLIGTASQIDRAGGLATAIGCGALVLLFVLKRWARAVPAALVVVVLAIVASAVGDFDAAGVGVVGSVSRGVKGPAIPGLDFTTLLEMVPAGLGLALVVFAEGIGNTSGIAMRHGERVHPNAELRAFGISSLVAGLLQGFPPGSSLSNSAANDDAGARTPMSSVIAACLILLVALALTPLFAPLPEPVLAAIVLFAVSGMFEWREIVRIFHVSKLESLCACVVLVGVLAFDTLPGLGLGVATSILLLLFRASRPGLATLARTPGGEFARVQEGSVPPEPNVLILRIEGALWFGNARSACDGVSSAQAANDADAIVLDLEESPRLDVTALDSLRELILHQRSLGTRLALARVHRRVREQLEREGLVPGEGLVITRSIADAVAMFTERGSATPRARRWAPA